MKKSSPSRPPDWPKRLDHTQAKTALVGLSGGLDSTLALLVMVRAADRLGWDRKRLVAVTMPCYGTTRRTRSNAEAMALALGVTFREIPIGQAVAQHFADIGLPPEDRSVTYENGQARERTQVLMDLAQPAGRPGHWHRRPERAGPGLGHI